MIFELAHHMALLPLAVLAWRRSRNPTLWLLAGVFLVAWGADTLAHYTRWTLSSVVYPLSQVGLVAVAFLRRPLAAGVLVGLTLLGLLAVLMYGVNQPELPFRAACWGGIVLMLWPHPTPVRSALLVYFGLGLLAWAGYVALPGWTSWGAFQTIRLIGIAMFCLAVYRIESRP